MSTHHCTTMEEKEKTQTSPVACWVCNASELECVRHGIRSEELASQMFQVTDNNYGITGTIFRCSQCGFLQCHEIKDVTSFYEEMADETYEVTRTERAIQMRRVLASLKKFNATGRLLDIGSGSGILVEEAMAIGYTAEGIELSKWMQQHAVKRGIPVHLGVFPHPAVHMDNDIITLIDIIEHVSNPVELLKQVRKHMTRDGIGLIITPDVSSYMARMMGKRWWHYRVAHIGYFNRKTLILALANAGLEPIAWGRPSWHFPLDYLLRRVNVYLPRWLQVPIPNFFNKICIPLNLFDSWSLVFKVSI